MSTLLGETTKRQRSAFKELEIEIALAKVREGDLNAQYVRAEEVLAKMVAETKHTPEDEEKIAEQKETMSELTADITDAISNLMTLEEKREEQVTKGRCPLCLGEIKTDQDRTCCQGCLMRVNRLLAQGIKPDQIATQNPKTLLLVQAAQADLDEFAQDESWHYRHGREAVEAALGSFYWPLDLTDEVELDEESDC